MVSTTGQLDAPLLDIGAVQREYWERKTVYLPSLEKLQKPKGIRGWFQKTHTPVIVLRRLKDSEWQSINDKFLDLRTELAKDANLLHALVNKVSEKGHLSQDEKKFLSVSTQKAMPIYIGMLELMIDEPKMEYSQVEALLDIVDQHDKDTLMAYVNTLTSEKRSVAQAVANERMDEVDGIRTKMMRDLKLG